MTHHHPSTSLQHVAGAALCLALLTAPSSARARGAEEPLLCELPPDGGVSQGPSLVDGGPDLATPLPSPPDVLYGELFVAVQSAQLFADQKVLVVAVPLFDPEQIVED